MSSANLPANMASSANMDGDAPFLADSSATTASVLSALDTVSSEVDRILLPSELAAVTTKVGELLAKIGAKQIEWINLPTPEPELVQGEADDDIDTTAALPGTSTEEWKFAMFSQQNDSAPMLAWAQSEPGDDSALISGWAPSQSGDDGAFVSGCQQRDNADSPMQQWLADSDLPPCPATLPRNTWPEVGFRWQEHWRETIGVFSPYATKRAKEESHYFCDVNDFVDHLHFLSTQYHTNYPEGFLSCILGRLLGTSALYWYNKTRPSEKKALESGPLEDWYAILRDLFRKDCNGRFKFEEEEADRQKRIAARKGRSPQQLASVGFQGIPTRRGKLTSTYECCTEI